MVRSSRKPLDPYPSLASIPDDDEEANEKLRSGMSITQCDSDVEIVKVPPKKRHCNWTSETGRLESVEPLRNFGTCIICEVSDQWVCRCSGFECFISFHGACLYGDFESSSNSDHAESTYCPYCWLKILTLRSNTLREKVVVAEKTVFNYLDKEMKSWDENTTQEHSVDGTYIVSDQELQVEKDFDKSRRENMVLIDETNQPEKDVGNLADKVTNEVGVSEDEERVVRENLQAAEHRKDNEIAKDQTQVVIGAGKEHNQVQQNEKRRRRQIQSSCIGNSSNESISSSSERNGEDIITEKVTSSDQVTSPSGTMKNQKKKLKVVAKSKTVRDIPKEKRRKLLWTLEEEEMLKMGVEKFAAESNKNMPWRKILEMGEKVFDETRTPSDLKDKWRRMNKTAQ